MKTLIAILMLLSAPVYGQSIRLFDIDTTAYPLMKAKTYVFDDKDRFYLPNISELTLREQGEAKQITKIQSGVNPVSTNLSIAISIDNSTSMNKVLFGFNPLELAKRTALQLHRLLPTTDSELLLQTSGSKEMIIKDFTNTSVSIITAIDKIQATAMTRKKNYMNDTRTGILTLLKRGRYNKAAIICSDGLRYALSEEELQQCKDTCAKYGIKVFSVMYSPFGTESSGIKSSLQELSESTGGYYYDGIVTQESVDHIVREIYTICNQGSPHEIIWQSERACESGAINRTVEIEFLDRKALSLYTISEAQRVRLDFEPTYIHFDSPILGAKVQKNVKIYARYASFNVEEIQSLHSGYTMTPSKFSIKAGDSITVLVEYNASDSGYTYSRFSLRTDKCEQEYYAKGGYSGKAPQQSSLKIISPMGGTVLPSGSDTLIRWEGVTPMDTVGLDFTTDNGITWYSITPKAWGLQYRWKNIPDIETNQCKIRIIHYDKSKDARETATLLKKIGESYQRAWWNLQSVWSPNSDKIAIKCYENEKQKIVIVDANTGKKIQEYIEEFSEITWSNDGKKITLVGNNLLNIWSVETGKLLHALPMLLDNSGSISDIWSPDDKYIAVYLPDSSIVIWDIEMGVKIRTIQNVAITSNDMKWSRDGNRIFYTNGNIFFALNVNNGAIEKKIVIDDLKEYVRPLLTSDQKKILYTTDMNRAGTIDIETEVRESYSTPIEYNVNWSPDGSSFVARKFDDKSAILWDTKTNNQIAVIKGDADKIKSIIWSPNSKKILILTDKRSIMYNAEDGAEIIRDSNLYSSTDQMYNLWSPNSELLLLQHKFIVDAVTWQRISSIGIVNPYYMGKWSNDGNVFAFRAQEGIVLWNKNFTDSLKIVEYAQSSPNYNFYWSNNGKEITMFDINKVIVWDVDNGDRKKNFVFDMDYSSWSSIDYNSQENKFAVIKGNMCEIYDLMTGNVSRKLALKQEWRKLSWSYNGKYIALTGNDSVVLWNIQNDSIESVLPIDSLAYSPVVWSPDGTMIAIKRFGYKSPNVIVWDIKSKSYRVKRNFQLNNFNGYLDIVWSPDSKKILVFNSNGGKLFDVNKNEELQKLTVFPYTNRVLGLGGFVWASDDKISASDNYESVTYIWDARTGSVLHTFDKKASHRYSGMTPVFWSPDAKLLSEVGLSNVNIWGIQQSPVILNIVPSNSISIKIERPFSTNFSIDIGDCIVGQEKDTMIVDFFKNIGIAPCRVKRAQYREDPSKSNRFISGQPPYTVSPGESHFAEFGFVAESEDGVYGYENFVSQYNDTVRYSIRGTGILPSLRTNDEILDFGIIAVGKKKIIEDTVLLYNNTNEPLNITSIKSIFPGEEAFSLISPDGNFIIPANSEQRLSLQFLPKSIGRQSGRLEIHHDGKGSPSIISLFGEGIEAASSSEEEMPSETGALSSVQVYPNPANTMLTCNLEIRQPEIIEITVYTMMGEKIKSIHKDLGMSGIHTIQLPIDAIGTGYYSLEIRTPSSRQILPIVVVQ